MSSCTCAGCWIGFRCGRVKYNDSWFDNKYTKISTEIPNSTTPSTSTKISNSTTQSTENS